MSAPVLSAVLPRRRWGPICRLWHPKIRCRCSKILSNLIYSYLTSGGGEGRCAGSSSLLFVRHRRSDSSPRSRCPGGCWKGTKLDLRNSIKMIIAVHRFSVLNHVCLGELAWFPFQLTANSNKMCAFTWNVQIQADIDQSQQELTAKVTEDLRLHSDLSAAVTGLNDAVDHAQLQVAMQRSRPKASISATSIVRCVLHKCILHK